MLVGTTKIALHKIVPNLCKSVTSLVPRPCGRREKWPGIHCLCMHQNPHDFMGYCILSFTNRYRGSVAHPSRANMASKSDDFDKVFKFAVCCIGKGDFTLKANHLDAIKCIPVATHGIWEVHLLRDSAT